MVTGSGHCRWSLGWEVLGTFSLIPTPTKIPMAIFCQETTNFFIAMGQIFAHQKSLVVCDEIFFVNFENYRTLNLKASIMSRIKFKKKTFSLAFFI